MGMIERKNPQKWLDDREAVKVELSNTDGRRVVVVPSCGTEIRVPLI